MRPAVGMPAGGAGNSERDGVLPTELVEFDPAGVIGGDVITVEAVLGVDEGEPEEEAEEFELFDMIVKAVCLEKGGTQQAFISLEDQTLHDMS